MPFMGEHEIRVLVVEDNPGDRDLVIEYLEMDGQAFGADFAPTLAEAFNKLRQEYFDVVLLDLGLPDSQGMETLSALVSRFPSMPVISLTGQDDDQTAVNAIRKGAQDYLVKGKISPDQIKRAIRYAINRKNTENELAAIYENAPVIMMLVDHDRRILRLNQLASVFSKAQNSSHSGQRGGDALQCLHASEHPHGCGNALACEQCDIKKTIIHTLETGDPVRNLETKIPIMGKGQIQDLYLSLSTARIVLNNEPKVLVALADVTKRVLALQHLWRNEALLKNTQSLTKIGGWEWDAEKEEMFWTDEVYNLHGFDKETFNLGSREHIERSLQCYHPEHRDLLLSAFLKCVKEGKAYDFEFPFTKFNGQRIWIRTTAHPIWRQGKVVRVIGNVMDITDRKETEQELRKSEAFLNATGKMAKVGGWELDAQTMDVRWTDVTYDIHEMPKTYKPSLEESINFFHPDDRLPLKNAISLALEKGKPYDLTLRFKTATGQELWTHNKCFPVLEKGKTVRLMGTFQDISENKAAQKEKRVLEEQFQQAQKLESVGRLAGGVAHDLNNMLTPILGFSEMLMDDFNPDDARKEFVQEILSAGMKAKELVAQLLAFSRKQVLEFKSLDLNSLLTSFEKLLRRTIREDVAIKMNLAESLPSIRGDIGQLEQVIMNLAVNAQDAMPGGGTLNIETAVAVLDQAPSHELENPAPGIYVTLAIQDTGTGMTPETRQHIFEPFFTTKGKEKGTGLGLATVYGIIKQHNGTILLDSEPGKGTVFKILLPALETGVSVNDPPQKQPDPASGWETILLVEDNAQVRRLARTALMRRGYKVIDAANGQEAINLLKNYPDPVHLLLTDVVMPEMSGKDLFERLSSMSDLKVIYMSGYSEDLVSGEELMKEHVELIQKPFSAQLLSGRVRSVLDEKS